MKTVLIAEDDRILLARLTKHLKNYENEFQVIAVTNGRQAIAALKQRQVFLLVTDIQMPEVDGLQLLAYVNKHHPVIFCFVMTAYGTPELKQRLPRGIIRYFAKPIDIESMAEAIHQIVVRDIPRGTMRGISVISFLQMIQLERKTCLFEVVLPGKHKGIMYFDNGVLYNAMCGDLKGTDAALSIISEQTADIRFKYFPDRSVPKAINASLDQLIEKHLTTAGKAGGKEEHITDDEWDQIISDVLD